MDTATNRQAIQKPGSTTTAGGENRQETRIRHTWQAILWFIGLLVLISASVFVHFHPQPFPIDVQATQTVQSIPLWPWLKSTLTFLSNLNDPIPSGMALTLWFVFMALFGWFKQAIFPIVVTLAADWLDFSDTILVGRPRPDANLYHIHVYSKIPVHSFPSGHTEHDVVYYGFLLYLSFTKPVRQWRYRWILIPFQIFAVVDLLSIGYSRILLGEHWLSDVLAGYLSGAVWLFLGIFAYRWVTDRLAERRERRTAFQPRPTANTRL